ncbi:MAG: TonB family protein [Syntrophorhabdaceae bacterium]|nr:TonB family protein [Syntrophorhabdaceae bacterium]
MNSRALRYPLVFSVAIHAAVLSGILSANAGIAALGRQASVIFMSIESPGNAGGSEASGNHVKPMTSGAPGRHRVTAHPPERPKPKSVRPEPDPRPDQESARLEPAKESGLTEKTARQESGREETGYQEIWTRDGYGENSVEHSAYELHENPGGNGGGIGGGTGDGAAGTSSPAAIANLPKPTYPRHSRLHGHEGTVVLETEVAADGKPAGTRIVRSSGYRHLDNAALDALKKASFTPAKILGMPIASTRLISIRFNIKEQSETARD